MDGWMADGWMVSRWVDGWMDGRGRLLVELRGCQHSLVYFKRLRLPKSAEGFSRGPIICLWTSESHDLQVTPEVKCPLGAPVTGLQWAVPELFSPLTLTALQTKSIHKVPGEAGAGSAGAILGWGQSPLGQVLIGQPQIQWLSHWVPDGKEDFLSICRLTWKLCLGFLLVF